MRAPVRWLAALAFLASACTYITTDVTALCGNDAHAELDAIVPDATVDASLDAADTQPLIFADVGQSNANGWGNSTLVPAYTASYPSVLLRQRRAANFSNQIPWVDTPTGALAPRCLGPTCFGTELSMGRALDAVYPGRVRIDKLSIDGSGLHAHWRPGSVFPTGYIPLHDQWMARLAGSIAEFGGRLVAVNIMLGETDALTAAAAQAYGADIDAFVAMIRAQYPDVAILLVELHASNAGAYTSTERAQQELWAASCTRCALINIDDLALKGDNEHLAPDSYIIAGQRIATAYEALH